VKATSIITGLLLSKETYLNQMFQFNVVFSFPYYMRGTISVIAMFLRHNN